MFCSCNFIKKETLTQVLSCEFCEIFKNAFLTEQSGRLLLKERFVSLWALWFIVSLNINSIILPTTNLNWQNHYQKIGNEGKEKTLLNKLLFDFYTLINFT